MMGFYIGVSSRIVGDHVFYLLYFFFVNTLLLSVAVQYIWQYNSGGGSLLKKRKWLLERDSTLRLNYSSVKRKS